ncbi:MAG: MFS transporter, partial [Burkholderiales bacterium]
MNRPSTTALDPGALPAASRSTGATVAVKPVALGILGALSASHLINDMMQSLILALYPVLKGTFALSFTQIGLITLTFQLTASLFQPLIGLYTDRRPMPYS